MKNFTQICFLTLVFLLACQAVFSQNVIKGEVKSSTDGEPLIGASIFVNATGEGTVTDFDGSFELRIKGDLPVVAIISYTGYEEKELTISSAAQKLVIKLDETAITTAEVEVVGRRISERQRQSALTMETLDNIAIKETPAANFYDGLGSLKDVDLTAASLGFKIINTRGFNSTSPVRSLQIIDGVDNQSPGLNFSLGNFLGASELDVNMVNLIVGASSAFYGPNAFNGVISMETKDPFLHKGLTAMVKGGSRSLFEGGIRYAHAFANKNGNDVFGIKFNLFYFQADDWVADNYAPVYDTSTDEKNPGGYDKVNEYGDEYLPANDFTNTLTFPGMGIVHRRGYKEVDLVDYNSRNLKAGIAAHWRLTPSQGLESPEIIFGSNYSTGTTVYQGDNRFSLKDIQFFQHKIELRKRDHYFLRAYATHEDAGKSYDPYFTALLLQRRAKSGNAWRSDYLNYWSTQVVPVLKTFEGYPKVSEYPGQPQAYKAALINFLAQGYVQDSLFIWHQDAQILSADVGNPIDGSTDYLTPGTPEYKEAFDDITSRISFAEGGTRFYDKSALFHAHGEYQFNDLVYDGAITDLDLRVGANARLYRPDSNGSILLDTFGRNISTYEYGIYGGGTLELNKSVKASASLRMDKNQNLNYLLSPAASVVYNPVENHTLRLSFSSAIRNPTLTDQYLFYNVGRAILIGNLYGFENLITIESLSDYLNTQIKDTLEYFNIDPIRPEKVKTLELGYRATLFDQLYIDATYYYSFYKDFIGYNLGATAVITDAVPIPTNLQVYRVAANASDRVTTQGFSIGMNYYFAKYFVVNGNYSWNILNTVTDDPIIPAFNTPKHKYNLGLSGRDIQFHLGNLKVSNFGFNINYKWIDTFVFEGSPQFTGLIPSYDLLDAQVNWRAKKLKTTIKLGASNILNNQTYQTYGGPRIGRLAYLAATYELK